MTTLYGIRNCDTVKKARGWLDAQGIAYAFHDYKTGGVPEERLRGWVERLARCWRAVATQSGWRCPRPCSWPYPPAGA